MNNMKKLLINILLLFGIILYAQDDNVTKLSTDLNVSITDTNTTLIDLNQSTQIKPNITNVNIDATDDDILIEGNATANLDVDVVIMINNNRIVKSVKSNENGYWSLSYKAFKQPLEDGVYDIFVSTRDENGNKSEITALKGIKRDTSINGVVFFKDGAATFSDEYLNINELKSAYINGQIDKDAKIKSVYIYNDNNNSKAKLEITQDKILFDEENRFTIANNDIPLNKLDDGLIFVDIDIEDEHKNSMRLKAKIIKDTIRPQKPVIIKLVKNNNIINGQIQNGLVFLGSAEPKSKIEVQIYNKKFPDVKTATLVKTDESSSWTVVGRDIEVKKLKNGNIVSEFVQIDVAGNRSDKLIINLIKEANPIFPLVPEIIPSEKYMPIYVVKTINDVVRAVAVNDKFIIAGTYEFIYYLDKKKAKIQKKIELKKRWVNSLALYDDKLIVALDSGEIEIRDVNTGNIISTIKAHKTPVLYLKIDDNNTKLVSSSSDGSVKIWDLKTYKLLFKLQKHQWDVAAIAINDGKVYTGSDDYSIKIWDLNSGKFIKNLKSAHSGTINALVVYKDMLISASDDKKISIRDIKTHKLIKTLNGHKRGVTVLKINHDKLISGSKDRTLIIWDLNSYTKEKQLRGHSKAIVSIDVKDENIVTGSLDYKLRVWGYDQTLEGMNEIDETLLAKYDLVKTLEVANSEVTSLAQTDSEIVFSTYGYVHFYNNVTYQYTRNYSTLDEVRKPLKKSDEDSNEDEWGEESLSKEETADDGWETFDDSDEDGVDNISSWEEDLEAKKKELDIKAKEELQWVNVINIQGTKLLAGLGYKYIMIWDLETNKAINLIEAHEAGIKDIQRFDDYIISSSSDGVVNVWNQEKMELLISIDAHQWDVRTIAVSDGVLYSGSDDYSIKVWDLETGDLIKVIKSAHSDIITKLAIYEKYLISASKDGTIVFRDKESLNVVKTINAHSAGINTFVLDEEHLISGSDDKSIKVWDLKTKKLIFTMKDAHDGGVSALMITDDYIVSGGKDNKINIWKYYE